MISRTASRGIAFFTALIIALIIGVALTIPTQAFADDTALAVSTLADDDVKVINTKASYTWVKAGKKVYQWGRYNKKIANGTLYLREMMCLYIKGWDCEKDQPAAISNLTSSNASVIKPVAKSNSYYIKYTSKKYGTATVTYTMSYTDKKRPSGNRERD